MSNNTNEIKIILPITKNSDKDKALAWLMAEIQKAEDSVRNEGWMTVEESKLLLKIN